MQNITCLRGTWRGRRLWHDAAETGTQRHEKPGRLGPRPRPCRGFVLGVFSPPPAPGRAGGRGGAAQVPRSLIAAEAPEARRPPPRGHGRAPATPTRALALALIRQPHVRTYSLFGDGRIQLCRRTHARPLRCSREGNGKGPKKEYLKAQPPDEQPPCWSELSACVTCVCACVRVWAVAPLSARGQATRGGSAGYVHAPSFRPP